MAGNNERLVDLARHQGVLRSSEVRGLGFDPSLLNRLAEAGRLERVGNGVYALPHGENASIHRSIVLVAAAAPKGVVCLLTALAFHGIGTQSPPAVWVAIATHGFYPRAGSVPLEVVQMTPRLLDLGAEEHTLEGVAVRITSPVKTVVDCFRYRSRVGTDVATEALREAMRERRFTMDELYDVAGAARVWNVIRPYAEALA